MTRTPHRLAFILLSLCACAAEVEETGVSEDEDKGGLHARLGSTAFFATEAGLAAIEEVLADGLAAEIARDAQHAHVHRYELFIEGGEEYESALARAAGVADTSVVVNGYGDGTPGHFSTTIFVTTSGGDGAISYDLLARERGVLQVLLDERSPLWNRHAPPGRGGHTNTSEGFDRQGCLPFRRGECRRQAVSDRVRTPDAFCEDRWCVSREEMPPPNGARTVTYTL